MKRLPVDSRPSYTKESMIIVYVSITYRLVDNGVNLFDSYRTGGLCRAS